MTSSSGDMYQSIFSTERDQFILIVRYLPTNQIIGKVQFIPDPRFPRYEIFDWRGLTVNVELEEPRAHKLLASVLNDWLEEINKHGSANKVTVSEDVDPKWEYTGDLAHP